jgi:hypothetical protein
MGIVLVYAWHQGDKSPVVELRTPLSALDHRIGHSGTKLESSADSLEEFRQNVETSPHGQRFKAATLANLPIETGRAIC